MGWRRAGMTRVSGLARVRAWTGRISGEGCAGRVGMSGRVGTSKGTCGGRRGLLPRVLLLVTVGGGMRCGRRRAARLVHAVDSERVVRAGRSGRFALNRWTMRFRK